MENFEGKKVKIVSFSEGRELIEALGIENFAKNHPCFAVEIQDYTIILTRDGNDTLPSFCD